MPKIAEMGKAPIKFVVLALAATVALCTAGTYFNLIDADKYELFDNKDLAIVRVCQQDCVVFETLSDYLAVHR